MRAIDPDASNLVFLLGAGASRPAPSNIPVARDLLPALLDRARILERGDDQAFLVPGE